MTRLGTELGAEGRCANVQQISSAPEGAVKALVALLLAALTQQTGAAYEVVTLDNLVAEKARSSLSVGDFKLLLTMLAVALILGFVLGCFSGSLFQMWRTGSFEKKTAREVSNLRTAASETFVSSGASKPPVNKKDAAQRRNVLVQGPVTYKRKWAQPRFSPLGASDWNAWPEGMG